MPKYLLDVNIPKYFGNWRPPEFQHVVELNDKWSDTEIWEYAKANDLTIITKDYDFHDRMLLASPPPRVIHFRVGNMKRKEFQQFIEENWEMISPLSDAHKLVLVYREETIVV
ncbi:MAG: DUF5615 family PIN-like protein [Saprospiraceae bacterium]